ncbi:MAG: hypothetical protein AAF928_19135, partial [Myxococcota bacterium]
MIVDGEGDDRGWLLMKLDHAVDNVVLEWAPAELPDGAGYPFRQRYWLALGGDDDEIARRRLSNLGFAHGNSLHDRVCHFQRRHAYTKITGLLHHIEDELQRYHDESRLPVVPRHVLAQPEPRDRVSGEAFDEPVGPDDDPPKPRVLDAPPAGEPPTAGRLQTGGGTPPGRGTTAPSAVTTLLVRMRARFSLKPDLTDIRLADGGRHLPQFVAATVELKIPALNLVLAGTNNRSTSHRDGILSSVDLAPLRMFLFPPTNKPVIAELVLTPSPAHRLPRATTGTAALRDPVGPTDGVPAGIKKEHMLFRPLHIDLALDPVTTR